MDDPYRGSQQSGICPRCANSTESDGEISRLVCIRGCGEWYPKATLDQILAWHSVEGQPSGRGFDGQPAQATSWPWGGAPCPICRKDMQIGHRAGLRFDYCSTHGVWLDTGEFQRFAQVFGLS